MLPGTWTLVIHILCALPLRWRHNERDCVSNHQPNDCFLNCLFRGRSKKTSKLRVTGLCAGNSPGTGEFPAQVASNAENVSIWWRHHAQACISHLPGFWLLLLPQIIACVVIHDSFMSSLIWTNTDYIWILTYSFRLWASKICSQPKFVLLNSYCKC